MSNNDEKEDLLLPSLEELDDGDSNTVEFTAKQKLEKAKNLNNERKEKEKNLVKQNQNLVARPPPSNTGPLPNASVNRKDDWIDYSQTPDTTLQPVSSNPKLIFAHSSQEGNPCLKFLEDGIYCEYRDDVVPDFIINKRICVLFVGIKFYLKQPGFFMKRLKKTQNLFANRIILLLIQDKISGYEDVLVEFEKMSFRFDCVVIPTYNFQEVGKYLTIFKKYEFQSSNSIKEVIEEGHLPRVGSILKSIKGINKTNSSVLLNNFSSFRKIMKGNLKDYQNIPGLGTVKCERMYNVFRASFRKNRNM